MVTSSKNEYAVSFFKKMIYGTHAILVIGVFFSFVDPKDGWPTFGGAIFSAAAALYVSFKYLLECEEKTKISFSKMMRYSYPAYIAYLLGSVIGFTRIEKTTGDYYLIASMHSITILLLMPLSTILSYRIFFHEGIHKITQESKEILTSEKYMFKFLGSAFVLPMAVLFLSYFLILGDTWWQKSYSLTEWIMSIGVVLILLLLNIREFRNFDKNLSL